MTDYDFDTGQAGTVRIRVLATTVEFWVKSDYVETHWSSVKYTWTSPNGDGDDTFGYPRGADWYKIRTITVTSSGTVSINIGDTGTSGVGDPGNKSVYVSRATKPPAPKAVVIGSIGHTTIKVSFTDNGNGGSTITSRQIGYGKSSTSPTDYINAAAGTATDLDLGTKYYFWGRVANALGWSPWSVVASATTLAGCLVRVNGVWKHAIPYVRVNGVWTPAIPYTRVSGAWKAAGV